MEFPKEDSRYLLYTLCCILREKHRLRFLYFFIVIYLYYFLSYFISYFLFIFIFIYNQQIQIIIINVQGDSK